MIYGSDDKPSVPESFPEMVGVLDTNDNWALASAATALSDAGIIFDIVAIDSVPANLQTPEPKWWTRPSRILVAKEDADEARTRIQHDMEKKAAKERVAALKNDTDKLLKLSIELKEYVDKSDENVLSLDVIKKAEEIEKLARSVKDKMKGPN